MTMSDRVRVLIVVSDVRDEHWNRSVQEIQEAVGRAIAKLSDPKRVSVELVNALDAPSAYPDDVVCLVSHPTPLAVSAVEARIDRCYAILVSGGERPAALDLIDRFPGRIIWFSGVYGRETQFEPWMYEWARRDFTFFGFEKSRDALFSGKSGVAVTAARFRQNLLPLLMILEAYVSLALEPELNLSPESAAGRDTWLTSSLRELTSDQDFFKKLSRDAAFISGWLRTQRLARTESASRLIESLRPFVPRPGGHEMYDPELDDALRSVLSGTLHADALPSVVEEWSRKVSMLCELLEWVA